MFIRVVGVVLGLILALGVTKVVNKDSWVFDAAHKAGQSTSQTHQSEHKPKH